MIVDRLTFNNRIFYSKFEKIKQILKLKSSKRCKILPNKNLPIKYNKITLPSKKM
ncbi:DUF1882 domain-containing protein [Sulfurovum sp. bin170]|nr:DUF1882 domain-containing protein [Sulfurovum sp. bin170]